MNKPDFYQFEKDRQSRRGASQTTTAVIQSGQTTMATPNKDTKSVPHHDFNSNVSKDTSHQHLGDVGDCSNANKHSYKNNQSENDSRQHLGNMSLEAYLGSRQVRSSHHK
jgi:hypothetical protein